MMITGLKSGLLNEPRFPRNYILTTSIRDSFLLLLCNGLTHIDDDYRSETRAFNVNLMMRSEKYENLKQNLTKV